MGLDLSTWWVVLVLMIMMQQVGGPALEFLETPETPFFCLELIDSQILQFDALPKLVLIESQIDNGLLEFNDLLVKAFIICMKIMKPNKLLFVILLLDSQLVQNLCFHLVELLHQGVMVTFCYTIDMVPCFSQLVFSNFVCFLDCFILHPLPMFCPPLICPCPPILIAISPIFTRGCHYGRIQKLGERKKPNCPKLGEFKWLTCNIHQQCNNRIHTSIKTV